MKGFDTLRKKTSFTSNLVNFYCQHAEKIFTWDFYLDKLYEKSISVSYVSLPKISNRPFAMKTG